MTKYKILMVESDDFLRELLGKKFQKAGLDFFGMKDFTENFIEQVAGMKPDLISLNILYPSNKSGLEMLAILKNDPRTYNFPIFILTNFTDKEYIEKAKSLGIIQWIITAEHTPNEIAETYSKFLGSEENSSSADNEPNADYIGLLKILSNITAAQNSHYADIMGKLEKIESKIFNTGEVDHRTADDLYDEAEKIVREAGKASTSFIQRKLKIGYARAAQLLDMLEDKKVIETGTGAKPRKVLS